MAATRASATRLNQIIAVRKGVVSDTHERLTKLHHKVQKSPLLTGISRSYRKINDTDPDLPGESTRVQVKASEVIAEVGEVLARLLDVTAAADYTNCVARASVVVDGQTLVDDAPVPYLLFLEKKLTDVETFIKKLPTLDPAEQWEYDSAQDAWATAPAETTRTQKVPRTHVAAPATDKHPAQVTIYQEDVVAGYWRTVKFSGALPARTVTVLLERVAALQAAVKFAREDANMAEVVDPKPGAAVFGYLFAPVSER